MTRYAIVKNARSRNELEAYLPGNYRVLSEAETVRGPVFIVGGRDDAGWTLDGYVAPRLASGLIYAQELALA